MDKEKAKFLLSSFRPDGQDTNDEQLKEALEFAMQDRELAEWLVEERAFDAQFSKFVTEMPVPEQLKEELCELLAHLDEYPLEANIEEENLLVGSLSSIQAPPELKGNILAAMEAQQEVSERKVISFPTLLRKYAPLSLAALLLLGIGFGFLVQPKIEAGLNAANLQTKAGLVLTSHFSLDHVNNSQAEVFDWLSEKELPKPQALPQGLVGEESIGCKVLNLNGELASLICFNTDDFGKVHLVVFDLDEKSKTFSEMSEAAKKCRDCKKTGLSTTYWKSNDQGFMLFSHGSSDQLSEVF